MPPAAEPSPEFVGKPTNGGVGLLVAAFAVVGILVGEARGPRRPVPVLVPPAVAETPTSIPTVRSAASLTPPPSPTATATPTSTSTAMSPAVRGGGGSGRTPRLRSAGTTANASFPVEVVTRIVRQQFGRFRLCYENGLGRWPMLAGRITITFVIGRDGSVVTAMDGGSTLPDREVVACTARAIQNISFPRPEHGIVTASQAIDFAPE